MKVVLAEDSQDLCFWFPGLIGSKCCFFLLGIYCRPSCNVLSISEVYSPVPSLGDDFPICVQLMLSTSASDDSPPASYLLRSFLWQDMLLGKFILELTHGLTFCRWHLSMGHTHTSLHMQTPPTEVLYASVFTHNLFPLDTSGSESNVSLLLWFYKLMLFMQFSLRSLYLAWLPLLPCWKHREENSLQRNPHYWPL